MYQRKAIPRFSTDKIAFQLSRLLVEDFRNVLPPDLYSRLVEVHKSGSILEWRGAIEAVGPDEQDDPYLFKVKAQLANLYKKYTFNKDVYNSSEVDRMSIDKFMDNQIRLRSFTIDDSSSVTKNVIMYAKGWIATVLKDFDNEEHLSDCYFAKKSSVGVPLRNASLAERYKVPITGSAAHISWFLHNFLVWNTPPRLYLERQVGGEINEAFREVDCLDAVLVPKTYKSRRMIMANTTIGGLYSNGLGRTITRRLLAAGYDIKSLQKTHGELAQVGSRKLNLTTADQSLASDNITTELIDRLLPSRWASALRLGRISKIRFPDKSIIETNTFSTMGIGFTFPLQTLLFLGLLKGISLQFFKRDLKVSAYGDDLIYDSRLHPFVATLFPKFGLVLNTDKTYSTGSFRESCGSDYFRGLDVRPFQLGGGDSGFLSLRKYEAFLYTIINGLRRRWSDYEVPGTLSMLGCHMESVGLVPYLVPSDFPDTAGVKEINPFIPPIFLVKHKEPKRIANGVVRFKYLRFIADRRIEHRHEPYLWDRLQQLSAVSEFFGISSERPMGDRACFNPVYSLLATFTEEISLSQPTNYRSSSGKRIRKRDTLIALQQTGRYKEQIGSSSFWT